MQLQTQCDCVDSLNSQSFQLRLLTFPFLALQDECALVYGSDDGLSGAMGTYKVHAGQR
jgi:hypothetical protein